MKKILLTTFILFVTLSCKPRTFNESTAQNVVVGGHLFYRDGASLVLADCHNLPAAESRRSNCKEQKRVDFVVFKDLLDSSIKQKENLKSSLQESISQLQGSDVSAVVAIRKNLQNDLDALNFVLKMLDDTTTEHFLEQKEKYASVDLITDLMVIAFARAGSGSATEMQDAEKLSALFGKPSHIVLKSASSVQPKSQIIMLQDGVAREVSSAFPNFAKPYCWTTKISKGNATSKNSVATSGHMFFWDSNDTDSFGPLSCSSSSANLTFAEFKKVLPPSYQVRIIYSK